MTRVVPISDADTIKNLPPRYLLTLTYCNGYVFPLWGFYQSVSSSILQLACWTNCQRPGMGYKVCHHVQKPSLFTPSLRLMKRNYLIILERIILTIATQIRYRRCFSCPSEPRHFSRLHLYASPLENIEEHGYDAGGLLQYVCERGEFGERRAHVVAG
jgi:hypothetical protein